MHYPVMTEKHVAERWQVSLKTLRRWRLDGEGPVWHKLFRHVRYHEADVLEFEHSSAQHLMTLLGIKRDFKPEVPEAAQGLDAKAEDNYFTAKEIAEAASLPIDLGQASKMSRLAQLAPDLIEAIALGRLEVGISQLLRGKLSASWLAQREALVAGSR
ncbi:MAG: helix-turn-helix transcriptional regulator [Giesbergeria sp.]